jgi:ribonuclease P protein component
VTSFAPPETLKRRAAFLHLAGRGRKFARHGFVMQALRGDTAAPLTVGYTATKKIGNAVARNRARRRLKEAARLTFPRHDLTGMKLVLICRKETATIPFPALCDTLHATLAEALR